jgi:hypothetical protein
LGVKQSHILRELIQRGYYPNDFQFTLSQESIDQLGTIEDMLIINGKTSEEIGIDAALEYCIKNMYLNLAIRPPKEK